MRQIIKQIIKLRKSLVSSVLAIILLLQIFPVYPAWAATAGTGTVIHDGEPVWTSIPQAIYGYMESSDRKHGTIESFRYTTHGGKYSTKTWTTDATVYLPYGYSTGETLAYNVLFIVPGDSAYSTRFMIENGVYGNVRGCDVFDWLIQTGLSEPFIAVSMATSPWNGDPGNFQAEFMEVYSYVNSVYRTYHKAASDGLNFTCMCEGENAVKSHVAYAGFSRGAEIFERRNINGNSFLTDYVGWSITCGFWDNSNRNYGGQGYRVAQVNGYTLHNINYGSGSHWEIKGGPSESQFHSSRLALTVFAFGLTKVFPKDCECINGEFNVVPHAFNRSSEEVMKGYISAFGWDEDKLDAYYWENDDGSVFTRKAKGYQDEDLLRMLDANIALLEESGYELDLRGRYGEAGGNGNDIVQIALNEIGAEGSRERNRGYQDGIKYIAWYNNSGMDYGRGCAWCCIFVVWCANELGLVGDDNIFNRTASCKSLLNHLKNQGYDTYDIEYTNAFENDYLHRSTDYTIKPGDLIFYEGDNGAAYGHVAIIEKVEENGDLTIVHGNWVGQNDNNRQVAETTLDHIGIFYGANTSSEQLNQWTGAVVVDMRYPFVSEIKDGTPEENRDLIYQFLRLNMGLNKAAAIGVIVNLYHESGFDPRNSTDDNGAESYGICQWHAQNKDTMMNWCSANGLNGTTLEGQLKYMEHQLLTEFSGLNRQGTDIGLYPQLQQLPDTVAAARNAVYIWAVEFEKCNNPSVRVNDSLFKEGVGTYWEYYTQHDKELMANAAKPK